jgi:exodeoxyribonuclease VII small subunit
MTFEESLTRLEEIIVELDSEHVDLDRALGLFQEGVERLREASTKLEAAERGVTRLVETADGLFERADQRG